MDSSKDNPDDLLDRALAAMRNQSDAGVFPAEQVLRSIAASRDAARRQTFDFGKKKAMKAIFKLAAAVLLAVALLALFLGRFDRRALAFADVARQLEDARTMTADLITTLPGRPATQMKAIFRGPGQIRFENADLVGISDAASGISLTLNKKEKTALVMHMNQTGPATAPAATDSDWLAKLKRIATAAGRPVGEKEIDGVKTRGFDVTDEGQHYVLWADAQNGKPVQVDIFAPGTGGQSPLVTLDHIQLGAPLPDSMFSTAVPPGYTAQTANLNFSNRPPTEKDLIDLLRAYAKQTGGQFPKQLGMQHMSDILAPLLPPDQHRGEKVPQEVLDTSVQVGRAMAFLQKIKGNWGYAGETTKMGDAAKPLFWYQPEGSATDRVIYADLHIGNTDPTDLPKATHSAFESTQPASAPSIEATPRSAQ